MESPNLYNLLCAEISALDAQIAALQEKRRQTQATAKLYAPEPETVFKPLPLFTPIVPDSESRRKREIFFKKVEDLRPGGMKREIINFLMKNGPSTVPEIQIGMKITHQPTVFRAVAHLKDPSLDLVYIDDNKKVNLKR